MNTNYFLFSCLPWVPDISLACGAVLGQRPINERLFMTLLPRGRTREKGLCHPGYFKLTFFMTENCLSLQVWVYTTVESQYSETLQV